MKFDEATNHNMDTIMYVFVRFFDDNSTGSVNK